MATSSATLHSFLNDQLTKNKDVAKWCFADFLNLRKEFLKYSREECGLIAVDFDPRNNFAAIKRLINNKNMVIAHGDKLFFADITTQKVVELQKNDSNSREYEQLKSQCSPSYQRAKGHTLDLVRSITGRAFNAHRSDDFIPSLNFYLGILGDTDRVMFAYMGEERKEQLRFDLKITLLLLLAQQQHEIDYQKTENRKFYAQQMKRCVEFLLELDPEHKKFLLSAPEQAEISDEKPVKYLGMLVGQELGQKIVDWCDTKTDKGDTKTIKDFMGALNEKRLYWVWASTFLKTVIALVPNSDKAAEAIRFPDPYTGNLSWALYYARFGLNLSLLLKHTIKGPWMSEEEAKMPWYERFQTQWDQRKFTLLNDAIWGTANLVCFFWLNGKSILGTWGDAITVALLVFDLSIAIWDFEEQKAKYNKAMLQYDEDIKRLVKQRDALKNTPSTESNPDRNAQIQQLTMQIDVLQRQQKKCAREWQMQKLSLINNMAYAAGLMLAFVVLTMPFIPIAAPVAATLGIVGAVVCLAFTVINNAVKGGIELYLTHQSKKEAKESYDTKMKEFKKIGHTLTIDERKLFFLEIEKLKAETEYQQLMLTYQSVNLVRNIMLDVLIPVVVFASLMFMPLGFGVLTLGAALGLAIATRYLVDALFKPEEKKELEFDQVKFDKFNKLLEEPKKTTTFFNSKEKISTVEDKLIQPLIPGAFKST